MNADEVEEAVCRLAEEPSDPEEFPFAFLEAFGKKTTTIKRLRAGTTPHGGDRPRSGLRRREACRCLIRVRSAGLVARIRWKPVATGGVGIRGELAGQKAFALCGKSTATGSRATRDPTRGKLVGKVRVLAWRLTSPTVQSVRSGHPQAMARPNAKVRDSAVTCVPQATAGYDNPREQSHRGVAPSRIGAYSVAPQSQRPPPVPAASSARPTDTSMR